MSGITVDADSWETLETKQPNFFKRLKEQIHNFWVKPNRFTRAVASSLGFVIGVFLVSAFWLSVMYSVAAVLGIPMSAVAAMMTII